MSVALAATLFFAKFAICALAEAQQTKSEAKSENKQEAKSERGKKEAFSERKALKWFSEYQGQSFSLSLCDFHAHAMRCTLAFPLGARDNAGEDEVIGPQGIEQFCKDISVEPEDVRAPSPSTYTHMCTHVRTLQRDFCAACAEIRRNNEKRKNRSSRLLSRGI
jgi:hypothetical protein